MALTFKMPAALFERLASGSRGTRLYDEVKEYFRYHGALAPLVRLMRDIHFSHKVVLLCLAFALPACIVFTAQFKAQWSQWQQMRQQQAGVHQLLALDRLVTATVPLQLSHAFSPGQPDKTLTGVTQDIARHYVALAGLHDQSVDRFGSSAAWQQLNAAYVRLTDPMASERERTQAHAAFAQAAEDFASHLRESAMLGLPATSTMHRLDHLSLDALPRLDRALLTLHRHLAALPAPPERTAADMEAIFVPVASVQQAIAELARAQQPPSTAPGTTASACLRPDKALHDRLTGIVQAARAQVLTPDKPAAWRIDQTSASQLHGTLGQLRATCLQELDATLDEEEARIATQGRWLMGVAVFGILIAAYVIRAFMNVMRGGMALIQSEVARMAKGDLSSRALARGDDEVADTLRDLRSSLARLADLFTVVRRGVASVSHASGDISSASEALTHRIEQASDAMSGLHQGIGTMLEHLEGHQRHVAQAVDCAHDLAADAGRSRRAMNHLAEVIDKLQDRSREIGKIVSLIDAIAFQTNLLALNASVEAAKAGASGKGFAVVASEVRQLAQRVADAAAQINDVVGASTNDIAIGQEIARGTVEAVQSTETHVGEMGRILTRLSDVTAQGRTNAEQMTQTLDAVNDNCDKTNHLVSQVTQAARELRQQSLRLAEQSSKFKLG